MSDNVPLLRLYEFMRSMSGEERLELARWITAKPELFNEWSRRSLRFFARYSNVDEDFHPPRPKLPAGDTVKEIRRGYDVAVLLADRPRGRWWEVEGAPELGFRFVDYELAPLRKTSAVRAEGEPAEKAGMRADLLLVSADGVAIVGEVKAATDTGHDTDPVLAMIQGLTACAQLLSPQQMERLERAYPLAQFRAFSVLDLFVIVVKPSQSAPSTFQDDLYEAAKELAPILAAEPSVPARRIAFIEARFDGRLELKLASKGTTSAARKKITSRSRRTTKLPAEPPDPDKEPRANRDPRELERKVALLREPHIAPLTAFVERLRAERGGEAVPWFDPTEAGVEARILFLLEAPGGRAALADGSGFISPDNDDRTAKTMWTLLREVGVDTRRQVVTWNVVPWYVGDDNRIRGVTAGDLDEARPALRELLSLLPNLRVVLLLGAKAARGWERAAVEGDYAVLRAPHPSPRGTASRPGARDEIRDALINARKLAGYASP